MKEFLMQHGYSREFSANRELNGQGRTFPRPDVFFHVVLPMNINCGAIEAGALFIGSHFRLL